jgi:carbamoyltransferase
VNIVGVSAGYHDSACCLLRDGKLVAAAQEERFSRIKHDARVPRQAFRYCLDAGAISIADVDCLAFFEDSTAKLGRQMWMGLIPGISRERRRAILKRVLAEPTVDEVQRVLGYDGRIEVVDHHLSHAASAYFYSGFTEAAILTVDGVGDWPTTTYARGEHSNIERIAAVDFPHSLGLFYSALTSYLGFGVNDGEYKVMGLAPYGTPRYVERIRLLVDDPGGADYRLDMKYFAFLHEDRMYSPLLIDLLGQPAREPESALTQFHMDVARSAQQVLEECLLRRVRYLHDQCPSDNLCMAGGVALNVVANAVCRREGPFKRLFVQPAAGDAGGALGAAAVAVARLSGERTRPIEHVYLGPSVSNDEFTGLLEMSAAQPLDFRLREADLVEFAAGQLAAGKVLGWCHGRCEFGPRALGARSILADPRRADMRDRINASVKKREAFRPFAPSVLASELQAHFQLDHPSPYMLETCMVTSELQLPAITHVDGSARVHSVSPDVNARFAALLAAFQRRTGCPILLNTSFNMRDEPIVLTALDALMCFARSAIDILVVGDFVLDRTCITPLWQMMASTRAATHTQSAHPIGHLVYTLL